MRAGWRGEDGWVGGFHVSFKITLSSPPRPRPAVSESDEDRAEGGLKNLGGPGGGEGEHVHVRDDPLMNWPSEDLAKLFSVRPGGCDRPL